jgi:hypothetical protein
MTLHAVAWLQIAVLSTVNCGVLFQKKIVKKFPPSSET